VNGSFFLFQSFFNALKNKITNPSLTFVDVLNALPAPLTTNTSPFFVSNHDGAPIRSVFLTSPGGSAPLSFKSIVK